MFTVQENEYILGLINVYKELGYKYYIVHTVTVENNVYDLCFYFSSETIEAISADSFNVNKAHIVYVDSSARSDNNYNPSTHSRDKLENSAVFTTTFPEYAAFSNLSLLCVEGL